MAKKERNKSQKYYMPQTDSRPKENNKYVWVGGGGGIM